MHTWTWYLELDSLNQEVDSGILRIMQRKIYANEGKDGRVYTWTSVALFRCILGLPPIAPLSREGYMQMRGRRAWCIFGLQAHHSGVYLDLDLFGLGLAQ